MEPFYTLLKGQSPPIISKVSIDALKYITNKHIDAKFSYIRVYSCEATPHILPKFISYRWLLKEVAHQTIIMGINQTLIRYPKKILPTFPIKLRIYSLLHIYNSKKEANSLEDVWLHIKKPKKPWPSRDYLKKLSTNNKF